MKIVLIGAGSYVFAPTALRDALEVERRDGADIVCVDLSGYHFGPVLDPVRSLVVFGKGQDVDTIFVDGKMIVDGGHLVHADEKKLKAAAPGVLASMAKAAVERDPNPATLEEILEMSG